MVKKQKKDGLLSNGRRSSRCHHLAILERDGGYKLYLISGQSLTTLT